MFAMAMPVITTAKKTSSGSIHVYICTGPQSKRYHLTSNCRGLGSCSGEIKRVTVTQAQQLGRTPCKWCFK